MRLICCLILLASLTPKAFAAKPVITGISGASSHSLTGTIIAIGGTAGTCTGGMDNINTCDSCAGGLVACNTTRIYDSLVLRIAATHTDPGNLILVNNNTNNTMISTAPHNSQTVGATWGSICTAILGGSCESPTTREGTVRVCVDKNTNNSWDTGEECEDVKIKVLQVPAGQYDVYGQPTAEGISDFKPYPGDEKVYIEDLETSVFPTLGYGGLIKTVRVFIGETNMTDAVPGSFAPQDLAVIEDGNTLQNNVVDGLENGKEYWFRVGLVDEANNLVQFFPPPGTNTDGDCDTASCKYSATPDQVLGLLTDDFNCFVASAAYGTALGPKLDTFREFRFKKLLPYEWGRRLVKSYYRYGPFAARFIHAKPWLRTATRGLLWPAYGFSRLSLAIGLGPAFFLSIFALTMMVALPLYGVRRFSRRA